MLHSEERQLTAEDMKMKRIWIFVMLVVTVAWGMLNVDVAVSMEKEHGHGGKSGSMNMEHGDSKDNYRHDAVKDGVRAEFQIMSLESMNMKDPEGNTHHIMVKFFDEAKEGRIKDVVGKVKVISPSGKEQLGDLTDYSGIYAANFTFGEKGKYGVICLFKVDGQKRLIKFWYPHG
jgi:hypothetical protein